MALQNFCTKSEKETLNFLVFTITRIEHRITRWFFEHPPRKKIDAGNESTKIETRKDILDLLPQKKESFL